jgi:hypothetical protein
MQIFDKNYKMHVHFETFIYHKLTKKILSYAKPMISQNQSMKCDQPKKSNREKLQHATPFVHSLNKIHALQQYLLCIESDKTIFCIHSTPQ